MIDKWIESVFIKRAVLAGASGIVSHLAAFLVSAHASAAFSYLSSIGLTVTVVVDQVKLGHFLTVACFAAAEGGREWIATKYPSAGKYL